MASITLARSKFASNAAGCDVVVCSAGVASFVPGLLSRLVNQMAFHPPEPAGYHVTPENKVMLVIPPSFDLTPIPDLMSQGIQIDVVRMWTRRRNTIHAFHFKCLQPRATILFSHGNSTDIGFMFDLLSALCRDINADVFAYEYTGYGESSGGEASEADLYADIDAAYNYLTQDLGIATSSIFLYGQSIGSVPSTELASRKNVGGVILHGALKSGLSIVHDVKSTYWFDVFKNIEKIESVRAPVFLIHGTNDFEVPHDHAVDLHSACPEQFAYEPWWVEHAGHNDIETNFRAEYLGHLVKFLNYCAGRTCQLDNADEESEF